MAMTKEEYYGRLQIEEQLAKQGYVTYSKILHQFELNITDDPGVIAYIEMGKGRIVVNRGLDLDALSATIRHEILHQYLEHEKRSIKHVAKILKKTRPDLNIDPDNLDDQTLSGIKRILNAVHDAFNISADYEISNRGYTDADKRAMRNLVLNGEIVGALVTEDRHPDWVDLTMEDMFDKLIGPPPKGQGQGQGGNGSGQQGQSQDQGSQQGQNGQQQQGQGQGQGQNQGQGNQQNNSSGGGSGDVDFDKIADQIKNSSGAGNEKGKGPQIGDKGDQDIQSKEDAERQKNPVDIDGNPIDKSNSQDKGNNGQGGQDGQNSQSKGKPSSGSPSNGTPQDNNSVAGSSQGGELDPNGDATFEPGTPERIKKIFGNKGVFDRLDRENRSAIRKEVEKRAEKALQKYQQSGIHQFRLSLDKFVKKLLAPKRSKMNYGRRAFAGTSLGANPEYRTNKTKHIPKINIYFDYSGSWNASKIKVGEEALGILKTAQRLKKLEANVYYFSSDILTGPDDPHAHGGTNGQPIMNHIKATKPDNVIIMTDSDIDDIREDITVPGSVWLLFKGGRSKNLIDHLHGRRETVVLDI